MQVDVEYFIATGERRFRPLPPPEREKDAADHDAPGEQHVPPEGWVLPESSAGLMATDDEGDITSPDLGIAMTTARSSKAFNKWWQKPRYRAVMAQYDEANKGLVENEPHEAGTERAIIFSFYLS
jgi:hypothetical protein